MSIENRISRIEKVLDKRKKSKIDLYILYAALTYFADKNGKLQTDMNELVDVYTKLLDIENNGIKIADTTLQRYFGKQMAEEIKKTLKK